MREKIGNCEVCKRRGKVIQRCRDGKNLCTRCYQREWARNYKNPSRRKSQHINTRIWFFLYGHQCARRYDSRKKRWMIQERLGFFACGGCCWICGEMDPFSLETHHITKKKLISLCGSCHQILHRMGWDYLLNERSRL